MRDGLFEAAGAQDEFVREVVLGTLRALKLGSSEVFAGGLSDPVAAVRIEALRGLVSLNQAELVTAAGADPEREVRIAVARGLGTLGDASAAPTLARLAADAEALVRAAATDDAVQPLLGAVVDPHIDVRKAAVRSLVRWSALPTVSAALTRALEDSDADVRGYARRALVSGP